MDLCNKFVIYSQNTDEKKDFRGARGGHCTVHGQRNINFFYQVLTVINERGVVCRGRNCGGKSRTCTAAPCKYELPQVSGTYESYG